MTIRTLAAGVFLTTLLASCTMAAPVTPTSQSSSSVSSIASSKSSSSRAATSSAASAAPTPAKVSLTVPFSPQAPFAEWDPIHEEACEEMSLIMVKHFLEGKTTLTREQAEQEVQELIAWETQNGYGHDVTAAELGVIAEKHYGLSARTSTNVSVESIKAELVAGNPVIIPAAGRLLGNPYFSGDGPWYHMLVITGYREGIFGTTFITNDPGTKRGEKYEYSDEVIINAIHDWTGVKEETAQGEKIMLIVTQD